LLGRRYQFLHQPKPLSGKKKRKKTRKSEE
jgi:hypothetical protein